MKKLYAVLLVLCLLSMSSVEVLAAEKTVNGVTTEIIADNNEYDSDDTAKITIKVTNNNESPVNNIDIKSLLGKELEFVGESESDYTIKTLNADETVKWQVEVKKTDKQVSDDTNGEPNEEVGKENNTTESETQIESKTQTEDTAQKNDSAVKTGDKAGAVIGIFTILAMFAIAVFAVMRNKTVKRGISLLIGCVLFAASFGQMSFIKAEEISDGQGQYVLSQELNFGKESYNFSVAVQFDKSVVDFDKTYTRGEWLPLLAESQDIDVDTIDRESIQWYFGDTIDDENGVLYEYLYKLGVIPEADNEGFDDPEQDVPLFEADKLVTREYAAYTAVKILGFVDEDEEVILTCTDKEEIKYPNEVAIALKLGLFITKDDRFNPQDYISEEEKSDIFAAIKALDKSLVIDEDERANKITYNDNVIVDELNDVSAYTTSVSESGVITVEVQQEIQNVKELEEGKIIVLQKNEENPNGCVVKITSISEKDGKYIITGTQPELEEVVSSVYLKDEVEASAADFVPAEGVIAEVRDSAETAEEENIYPLNINEEFDTSRATIGITVPLEEGDELSFNFSVPTITAIVNMNGLTLNELAFLTTTKTNIALESSLGEKVEKKQELGEFKLNLPYGFSVTLGVYLYIKADAKASIGFVYESTSGVQYKDGMFRRINHEVKKSLDEFAVEGSASFGPGLNANIGWGPFTKIIGAQLSSGITVEASVSEHPDAALVCVEAAAYLPLILEFSDESLVGKALAALNIEVKVEIFDKDNSPISVKAHLENLKRVDECTYGKGKFVINVFNENRQPLKNAKVTVERTGDPTDKKVAFTNSEGELIVGQLDEGSYLITTQATGYKKFEKRELIREKETVYVEAILMVPRNADEKEGTIAGTIKNGVTAEIIDAEYEVRAGSNADMSSEVIETGASEDGRYAITLPEGYYTVTFKKDQYYDLSVNITINSDTSIEKEIVMAPQLNTGDHTGTMRIVLTWGEFPLDLDSHLLSASNDLYHVYYGNKEVFENGTVNAELDVDDRTSYGPETVTIYEFSEQDNFSYYVHDYSDKLDELTSGLSESDACVRVYDGENLIATYYVPLNKTGTLWHVFDYNPNTKELTSVNTFSYVEDHSSYFYGK